MASVVNTFFENMEAGSGNTGLSSKFEVQTELIKMAAMYSLISLGAFTVVNGVVNFLKPAWTRLMKGNSEKPSVADDDQISESELLEMEEQKGKGNETALALLNARKPHDVWNTALFFPDRDHNNPKMPDSSTKKLLHLLDSAKVSIKMCMYVSSYNAIRKKIVQKFQEGLIVRLCTCNEMAKRNSYRQVRAYTRKGIPVRMKPNLTNLMHSKFVLIDDEAVITGSLNWTEQGIAKNLENVLVTTDPRIVSPYLKEFALLWNNYDEYESKKTRNLTDN